jgi:hypothetical protein
MNQNEILRLLNLKNQIKISSLGMFTHDVTSHFYPCLGILLYPQL